MVLGVIVAQVSVDVTPVDEELTLACAVAYQIKKRMLIAFNRFCLMVSLAKPLAVELLTWIGMAGCGYPSLRSKVRIGTASWPLM